MSTRKNTTERDPDNLTYCQPSEAGLASESRAVGRTIGKALDALGQLNSNLASGPLIEEVWQFKTAMIAKLREDGWRIKINQHDNYSVLPPKDYRRDAK